MFLSLKFFSILTIINISVINALPTTTKDVSHSHNRAQISWIQQMQVLRQLLKSCENSSPQPNGTTTWQCLKMTSLNIVDDMTKRQIIPLWPGVRFVKTPNLKKNQMSSLSINQENDFLQRKDLQYLTWFDRLALSFTKMVNTHMLEINLKELTQAYLENVRRRKDSSLSNDTDPVGTARHRRHRFNMMITMMFGVTALGAVLVPMGFQMLSVVSGKALLLAKMALLLASINGLKRVANSGVHYGLYHVPGEHYANYYDRGDLHHPRNVQSVAAAKPIEMGLPL
ncbi:uncharacterized protein LOC111681626 [Lucilia cuprina]|uniref:uncharacterized protein LOC111681626 n=1 Tax=Lucilia cuprina TaxID=7375 RepID=UPI001F068F47|nr:uncharacterized protein LOC111681626 [Lucilia cuprina]